MLDKILNSKEIDLVLKAIYSLSPGEIKLLVFVVAFLVLYLVFKRFGIKMAMALGALYLIIYALYINSFLAIYSSSHQEADKRMEVIQHELDNK